MSEPEISIEGVSVEQARPILDQVLVRPLSRETERPSGLVLPDRAVDESTGHVFYGVVEAVGPGAFTPKGARIPPPAEVGDHVICKLGFGPEVAFREGRRWIVGRGNMPYGHGVLMAFSPDHVHCWHLEDRESEGGYAAGVCDAEGCPSPRVDLAHFSGVASCSHDGPRLLESSKDVEVQRIAPGEAAPTGAACLGPDE